MRVESSPATRSLGHNLSVVRKIFLLIFSLALAASLITIISVSASDNIFKITNTAFVDASQGIQQDFYATDEASIAQELLFHKVGDYATYKVTFNNSDSTDHTIESITDDNQNNNISLEYDDYSGTQVNAGNSFDFILTIKYISAVDSLAERDQFSAIKLYIKYKDVEKSDEIDIDPAAPETLDTLNISIIVLIISGIGLIVLIVLSTKSPHKKTQTIAVILAVAIPLFISVNAIAISEGTDTVILSSKFGLYDKLAITLDVNGVENTIAVDYNSAVSNIANPEAPEGYDFDGWKDESGNPVLDDTKLTEDTKLVASFKAKTYSISYTGTEASEEQGLPTEYTIETSVSIDALPNRKDADEDETAEFIGWKAQDETTTSKTVTIPVGSSGDKTYTAIWNPVDYPTYTIAYELNGATTDPGNKTTYQKTDADYTLANPEKTGYTFDGWTCNQLNITSPTTTLTIPHGTRGDLTIVANFTIDTYSISYTGLNSGEEQGLPTSYTINDTVNIPALNNRADSDGDIMQTFLGWSDSSGSSPASTISFSNETGDKSYEAKWQNETYPPVRHITYDLDGGSASNPDTYTKQDSDFTLNNPTKTGYTFTGWSGSEITGEDNMSVAIDTAWNKDLSYTAHYSPIQYTVNFDVNFENTDDSDTTTMDSKTFTYGVKESLPANAFDVKGYTFAGWKDANDTKYLNEAEIENLCNTAGCSVTLYAQWAPNTDTPYTIELYFENINDDDYTLDDTETKTKYGTTGEQTAVIDFNEPSYSFTGFNYDHGDPTSLRATIDRHGNTVIKLYYKRIRYGITFDANGGTIDGTDPTETTYEIEMKYGATISKDDFPTATQSGSDFAGWFTEAEGGQKITDDISIEGTDTIYAHWTPSEVTLCRKATELHVETCRNNAGGCKNTGYTVMNYSTDPPTVATAGTKDTSDIVYGNISDGDSVQKGDAFDCDVNGDGDYDSNTERFYYIRSTDDKAILIYSNNFQDGAPGYTKNYNYVPAIAQLPTTQQWTALTDVATTYDNNRIARFLNIEDLSSACNITSLSNNLTFPETCSFMLENTSYYAPNDTIAMSGVWTEVTNGDDSKAFRIHSSTLKFTYMGKDSSKNVARPIIEIPIDQLDTSDVEMVTISFNTQGGNTLQSFDMGKGNPLRFREQDYTPTRAGYTFKGWCLDSECETEPNYSTIINSDTTLYAKWEEMDTVAAIGSTGYPSLTAAIAAVPTTEEATEVVLLKSTSESTITTSAGQNIVLNLQDEIFTASNKNALQLSDGSKLKLVSGTIKSSQSDGAINVNQGSEFEMTGGTINVSGKQAIYVNGGTATIYGGDIISTSTQRAAIHNVCSSSAPACTNTTGGVINILGGTIQNSKGIAIKNEKGTLNIGTHDGHVETSTPHIIGKTIGVVAGSSFRFYDGTIEGETWPVGTNDTTADTNYTKIAGIETGSELIKDHDSTPKKIYLAPTTGTGQ